MKRELVLLIILFLMFIYSEADELRWAWRKGSSAINQGPIYNSENKKENTPGSRHGGALVCHNNKIYLFGGIGQDGQYFDDVWEYDIVNDVWDRVKDTGPLATYDFASCFDGVDSVYVFGGLGSTGEFWKYSISRGEWIELASGPSPRYNANLWCYYGYVYLFGGMLDSNDYCNDLWVYDGSSWKSELDCEPNNYGIFSGLKPKPGSRRGAASWVADNKLWLFGGYGFGEDIDQLGSLSDIWAYDINYGTWSFEGGSKVINDKVVGNPDPRKDSVSLFHPKKNTLWLFGGNAGSIIYNDFWYRRNNDWENVRPYDGNKLYGTYEEKGFNELNYPGARYSSNYCIHYGRGKNESIWIFGGYGYDANDEEMGHLNDLWEFRIKTQKYIDKIVYIDSPQEYNGDLTIKNTSKIFIPPSNLHPVIINHGDEPIIIEGGEIVINIETEGEFNETLAKINSTKNYEIILVSGKYDGSFYNVLVKVPDEIGSCEEIDAAFNENEDKSLYSVLLTLNSDPCKKGLKPWIIGVICASIIILLATAFIIVVLSSKKLRKKILPYRDLKKEYEKRKNEEDIDTKVVRNEVYQTKTKRNPIHVPKQ